MPGQLAPGAKCPTCGVEIEVLVRATRPYAGTATLEFHHVDRSINPHVVEGSIEDVDVIHDRLHKP